MKEEMQDRDLEELFRRKLENAEITPGADVNARLMRNLARKEFLKFNPVRFNIYYLGLIVAVTLTAGILLFGGKHSEYDDEKQSPEIRHGEVVAPETRNSLQKGKVNEAVRYIPKAENDIKVESIDSRKIPDTITTDQKREKMAITPAGIDDQLTNSKFFSEPVSENKLKEPSKAYTVTFDPSVISGCLPLKVHFGGVTDDFSSYQWNFADEGTSNKKEVDWTFYHEGEYRISLIARTSDGFSSTFSRTIRVFQKPIARFEISPENAVIPDDEIRFLNNSSDAVTCKWSFGDGNTSDVFEPKHRYDKYGNYSVSLIVLSEEGCADTVTLNNAFQGSGYFIDMPNAFIPNIDGPSDGLYSIKSDESSEIFHPVFAGVSEYHMKIYSKMGFMVFESNDVNKGWDGYFKGQLSNPGVYIWKIAGYFRNGQSFNKIGDVTLLRN